MKSDHTPPTSAAQYELLNSRTLVAGAFDTAIVPLGSCESHGAHLPFGMDALTAHALALRVGKLVSNSFVLPPTFFGMSQHYRHQALSVSLSTDTTLALFRDIFRSLFQGGIKNIFILNGHDGNIPCWELAARDIKVEYPEINIAGVDWWVPISVLCPPDLLEVWSGWGHGGEAETSMGLELFEEWVDIGQTTTEGAIPKVDNLIKQIWLFQELTQSGSTGAPASATREKGRIMAAAVVQYVADYINRQREHIGPSY